MSVDTDFPRMWTLFILSLRIIHYEEVWSLPGTVRHVNYKVTSDEGRIPSSVTKNKNVLTA